MSLVVDAGDNSVWAEEVLARGSLHAPELVLAEATNILRRMERARLIATPEANAAHEDLMALDVELLPFEPFADRICELRHGVTSSDAWYVAVAEALAAPLATLDKALARAKGPVCKFLLPAGEFPP